MEEERFDADKAKKRREERRKRRLRRQKAAMGEDYESEEENDLAIKPEFPGILKNNNIIDVEKNVGVAVAENIMTKENVESVADTNTITSGQGIKKGGIRWATDVKPGNGNDATTKAKNPPDTTLNAQSTSTNQNRDHTTVFCPVCQRVLTMHNSDSESTPDDFLSKHIDECQRESQARGGGRTLRKRTKPAVIEIDEDNDDEQKPTVCLCFVF